MRLTKFEKAVCNNHNIKPEQFVGMKSMIRQQFDLEVKLSNGYKREVDRKRAENKLNKLAEDIRKLSKSLNLMVSWPGIYPRFTTMTGQEVSFFL